MIWGYHYFRKHPFIYLPLKIVFFGGEQRFPLSRLTTLHHQGCTEPPPTYIVGLIQNSIPPSYRWNRNWSAMVAIDIQPKSTSQIISDKSFIYLIFYTSNLIQLLSQKNQLNIANPWHPPVHLKFEQVLDLGIVYGNITRTDSGILANTHRINVTGISTVPTFTINSSHSCR